MDDDEYCCDKCTSTQDLCEYCNNCPKHCYCDEL